MKNEMLKMSSSPHEPGKVLTLPCMQHSPLDGNDESLEQNRNWDDRGSPVATEIRWPRFLIKSVAHSPRAPKCLIIKM